MLNDNKRMRRKVVTRDSLSNFKAGLGLNSGSLLSHGTYRNNSSTWITMNRTMLESMYRSNWVIGKVVDILANDMTKSEIELLSSDKTLKTDDILREISRMNISTQLGNGVRWGSLYGGAIGVLMIDGEDLSTPLNIDAIQKDSFKGITIYDRWYAYPDTNYDREMGSNFRLPVYYNIFDSATIYQHKVHHSRCIRFIGHELPYAESVRNLMWGQSVVERIYDRILIYDSATYGGANLILKSFLRTLQIDGLREVVASGGEMMKAMLSYVDMVGQFQNNNNMYLIDKQDEMSTSNWSFSGMDKALTQFGEQLAGATDIPLVRLFGQPPGGFNSSGEIDMKNYYDTILSKQEAMLRPAYDKIIPIIAQSLYGKPLSVGWSFTFSSQWQPSDSEKAIIAKHDTESVCMLFDRKMISAELALEMLRGSTRWSKRYGEISDEDIANAKQLQNEQTTIEEVAEE